MDTVGYLEIYTDEEQYLLPLKVMEYGSTVTILTEINKRPRIVGRVGYVAIWIEPLRFIQAHTPDANSPISIQATINRSWAEKLSTINVYGRALELAIKELS